ncbi:MAG: hypothetical protein FWG02_09870 [Holophagaceae bacterium]|nr:hypothetical protein [Holophagaceae bacterium]
MSLNNEPVPMPEKRVTFKKGSNGTLYVYCTLRAYRNKRGRPTSDEVAIGKKDSATGLLVPNRRYFELFPGAIKKASNGGAGIPARVSSCGDTFLLMRLAEAIGLRSVLESNFPDRYSQMLAAAFYILCEGNVMMYIEDWFDETEVQFAEYMDDQQCSRLFASITYDERTVFFKEWAKLRSEQEYIAYDVTSISTSSKGIDIAEWGYNRDGENIPQINLVPCNA